jgi:cation transport regulator
MPSKQLAELPSELKRQLIDGSEQIFLAAFNSASRDGMSEEAALEVAWNSVKNGCEKGDDGKWHRTPDVSNCRCPVGRQLMGASFLQPE